MRVILGAVLLAASTSAALARGQSLPDLNSPANALGDERKYFVFHKAGVSFEQARDDLAFCSRYIPKGAQRATPSFVHWTSEDAPRPIVATNNYGLVGAAIGAIVAGPINRSLRQSRLMRCMLPRGYYRYRVSEKAWKSINEIDPQDSILVQARIASGPVPPTPRTFP